LLEDECLTTEPSTSNSAPAISYNYESILSLLVKTVHRNKTDEQPRPSASTNPDSKQTVNNKSNLFKLEFLENEKANRSEESLNFKNTRIGDENDFILCLLEQAATLNERCRLNMEKTVENINRRILAELNTETSESNNPAANTSMDYTSTSAKSAMSPSTKTEEELKNKKARAMARQQKLLAQMSSNQKAFLSNPSNKTEIEAFEELAPPVATQKEPVINDDTRSTITAMSPQAHSSNSNLESLDSNSNASIGDSNSTQTTTVAVSSTSSLGGSNLIAIKEDESRQATATAEQPDEIYDCCICRFSSKATVERPIGVVAFIQSTNGMSFLYLT
jgi:hypothetical protein